ncbi:very short patch repair endonuclease [Paraburkholderia tropica]|uniref:very short patch repair endonuclease n=1 Tax=Paraburkholderia tropica TaxID=92647 RepID=UPI002AB7F116|nr:very short patch repair endonuclease [Paraburkholderia tropica]
MTTPETARSQIMRAIHSKDTQPELVVRRVLYALGYRYRLHRKSLPGSPDLVFSRRRKVIFVHGCFWHGHDCKRGARKPKSNADYWQSKIARNRARDARSVGELESAGWEIMTVWECELRSSERAALTSRLVDFLGPTAII